MAVLLFGTVACDSSDGEGNLSLAAPAIGQSEERSTEPVLLAFGWSAVEDAAEYAYRLDEVVGEELHPLLSGKTAATSVELGGERGRTLSLGTTYRFSVQALPAEGVTLSASAFASVDITTSEAPIALTVENLTYRSARLQVEPKDGALLYQFAQIPVEKYLAYDSDMAFIEGYDFGYYKAMTAAMPWVKWYQWMEEASKTGNSVYDTRILNPGVDYMLYAYGVEFDSSNEEEPVRVTTPLYIKNFTTPEWKATSNCTFDVEVTGQELVEVTDSETGEPFNTVNVTVEVTPSDDTEHYYVAFPPERRGGRQRRRLRLCLCAGALDGAVRGYFELVRPRHSFEGQGDRLGHRPRLLRSARDEVLGTGLRRERAGVGDHRNPASGHRCGFRRVGCGQLLGRQAGPRCLCRPSGSPAAALIPCLGPYVRRAASARRRSGRCKSGHSDECPLYVLCRCLSGIQPCRLLFISPGFCLFVSVPSSFPPGNRPSLSAPVGPPRHQYMLS